jgi:hypothetical protein
MIVELADLLENLPGPANQTRCFMHIINLVIKSIIQQFDLPSSKGDKNFNEATKELLLLAGDINFEEDKLAGIDENGIDGIDGDNTEGWIDERETMSQEELDELDESIAPVRSLLTKVSN